MENVLTLQEVEQYVQVVIPNIESELVSTVITDEKRLELYNLYIDVMRLVAPCDFETFNKYLELDEDHNAPNKAFYHHRKNHMGSIFKDLNDMEIYDMYDMMLISMPPRVGKTTTGVRFLAWIIGRHPENTQLAVSYADGVTTSFYIGVMEIIQSQRYKEVFNDAPLVNQNAKREEIWLKVFKRYPSITFVPIGGSMTGRAEAGNYLYCDDLVSGIEEALSITRLEKLWQTYTVNCKQRKKDGCKEIHIATRWSVHDPITKLALEHEDDPRCKIISIPCLDENDESNFNFTGGFSTNFYHEMRNSLDELSFNALYMCEPIEREGLLYHKEDMQYYFGLPNERPESIISVCDSKNLGKDYVASLVGYVYGDMVFIDDAIYDKSLPEITRPRVADMWHRHNVVRADVEMNNGGNYYAEDLNELIKAKGGKTSIRMFFSSNNKTVKIITYSDFIKKHFVFRDPSTYSPNSDYGRFMKALFSWTQNGKNKNDDAPDVTAMLAQLTQELQVSTIKILNRRELGL